MNYNEWIEKNRKNERNTRTNNEQRQLTKSAGDRSSGKQKTTLVMNDSESYIEVDRNVENLT